MDILLSSIILIIIIIVLFVDVSIKEKFDVGGIDSAELEKLADNYAKGSIDVKNINAKYFSLLPKGSVVMYHGTSVPTGWAICDGKNGTPNLMGRIPISDTKSGVLGGPNLFSSGSTNTAGNHTHSVSKGTKKYLKKAGGAGSKTRSVLSNAWTGGAGNHSHTVTVNSVKSIYPDRTTVLFIMKL